MIRMRNVLFFIFKLSLILDLVWCESRNFEIGKLIEIRRCNSSADCAGRSCYKGLCTGLAGNDNIRYTCYKNQECIINSIPGYFDVKKQSIYKVIIIPYEYECNKRSSEGFSCLIDSENSCSFQIPLENLNLGYFKLCGTAFPSNLQEKFLEFNVPIGVLEVFGFKEYETSKFNKPTRKKEIYVNYNIPIENHSFKICTANVPCSINGIQGLGISNNARILEIYNSTSNSCGEELSENEIVYVHKCHPFDGGTECYINSISTKIQITKLCGCMINEYNNCSSPIDYKTYLGSVMYHKGIVINKNNLDYNYNSTKDSNNRKLQSDPCASCVNGYGLCYGTPKTCYGGFGNNPYEPPTILCVDGYDCRVKGKILGEQITSRYKVAASPIIGCGVRILGREETMFHSRNQWNCEGGNPFDCEIHFGVGRRYNRSEVDSNTMLLCGCPDFASVGMPCDDPAEFYFPVARIKVVECTDNTHCMHNALASCNLETNQCQGVLPSVAQIGLGTMQCLARQTCTIANIGQFIGGEMYRVIQTAPYVKCGANVALDPEYYQKVQKQMESTGPGGIGLPCIVQGEDSNHNSNCAINLGTNAILGVNRLCGCSGVDRDGNGIPCDSVEDFDTDLGLLDVGECNSDKDCRTNQVCTEHKCLNDQLLPYPVLFSPLNHSTLIPPVKELVIRFNENINYPKNWQPRRLIISSNIYYHTKPLEIFISPQKESKNHQVLPIEEKTRNSDSKWTWWNKSKNQAQNSQIPILYTAEVKDQKIVVSFDSRTPLPEDNYVVGLEPGAVVDLHGNPNDGIPIWTFTISRNASCPYMYVTGFSTNNGNINGLYTPWKSPMNGKAVWNGGERKQFYIYYSILDSESKNGTWVIDRDLDNSDIISFAESTLVDPNNHIPPDSKSTIWKKWTSLNIEDEPEWFDHNDISIICRNFPEKTPPSLIGIQPSLGSVNVPTNNTVIKLTFNRAMNYGHWAWFNITGRNTGHLIHIPTDYEAKNRGLYVVSNQTSDVYLYPYEPLVDGEVYDITVELGALTDLTYQPWGNVGPNQLFFTTSGEICNKIDLSMYYDQNDVGRYSLAYNNNPIDENNKKISFPAGTNAVVKCNNGYSTENDEIIEGYLGCVRGKWEMSQKIYCFQKCKPYPISSTSNQNYLVQNSSKEHEEYVHGSKLNIICVGTEGSEAITCNDGTWSALKLICGTSCPPYMLPNENYIFKSDQDRLKNTPESEIVISCTENSDKIVEVSNEKLIIDTESKEFTMTCIQGYWKSDNDYRCLKRCNPISKFNFDNSLVVEYNKENISNMFKHGSLARIRCSEEWSNIGKVEEVILSCHDGSWFTIDNQFNHISIFTSLPTEFKCEKKCSEIEMFNNKAYKIEDISYIRGYPKSKIRISCDREFGSTQFGTKTTDVIECTNGVWGISKTVCLKHCSSPELVLGNAYEISTEMSSRKKNGLYSHGTRLSITCSDQGTLIQGSELHQTATCTNGEWIFDNILICASKCSTLKLPARYHIRSQDNSDVSADTGDTRYVTCTRPNNSDIEERIVCKNGEWKPPKPRIECFSDCELQDAKHFRENYEILGSQDSITRHGEFLKIRCKQGYVRKTGPSRDKLICYNGVFQTPALICEKPTCFDGIQNQGEFGIDCGGICEKKCPDTCFDGILNGDEISIDCGGSCGMENCPKCNDGIKNGDETGIDCGGSQCPTCEPCHGFPMNILPENTILSVDGGFNYIEDIQKESFLIDNMAIASGSELHIRCIPGWELEDSLESKLLILSCNDGKWSFPDPLKKVVLKCSPPSCDDGIQNGDEWGIDCGGSCDNHCSTCNDGIKNGDEIGIDCGGSNCRKCNSCDSEIVRKLINSEKYILSGDGIKNNIFYHNSKLQVNCPSSEIVVTMTCNDGEWINKETIHSLPCGDDNYLKATQTNNQLEDFLNIPFSSLDFCNDQTNQCCKIVRIFIDIWNGECGMMYRQGRDTMIKTFCKGKCMNTLKDAQLRYKNNRDQFYTTSVDCIAADSVSRIIEHHLCQSLESKNVCSFSFHETLLMMNNPSYLLNEEKKLKIACEKESCHRKNLKLIQALSNLTKLTNMDNEIQVEESNVFVRKQNQNDKKNFSDSSIKSNSNDEFWKIIVLSQSEKALDLLCLTVKNPINNKEKFSCTSTVSKIITNSKPSINWLLSLIQNNDEEKITNDNLVNKCIRNNPEDMCFFYSIRVFGQLLLNVGTETNNDNMIKTGFFFRSFGRYYCQESRNNKMCGQILFSNIRGNSDWWDSFQNSIFGNISTKDTCNLYHSNFSCSPHCKKKLVDQINNRGCCFAAQLEIQRGILSLEYNQYKLNIERSIDYLEQRCGFTMDRVCSSGVKTDNVILEFIFKNLNYFEISNTIQEELLRNSIRETLSRFLSLPITDIPRIRSWPGSYIVEVLIDAGLATRTVLWTLEENKGLINELNKIDFLDEDFGISITKITQSHSRSLSTNSSPPPPFVGTFDMDTLANQLDYPSCPKPTLSILGINEKDDGYEITGDNSLKQGAFRNVACIHSYQPVPPSPASQSFICDNGRWRITQNEPKIICKKTCIPFSYYSINNLPELSQYLKEENNFNYDWDINNKYNYANIGYNADINIKQYEIDPNINNVYQKKQNNDQFLISGIGNTHGSTRSITCSAGYISDNPNIESETFKCIDGIWESNTDQKFNCVKGAETQFKYCKVNFLSNILEIEKYKVEELFDLNNLNNWKVFKITCSRGYESVIEPILLVCNNGNFYNIPGDTLTLSKNDNPEFMSNLIIKSVFGKDINEINTFNNLIPKLPSISFSNSTYDTETHVNIYTIINCVPKQLMKLSESKGLSGPALYAILFAPLIFGMLVLAILFWFRKYKWKKNSENQYPDKKETLAILDIKKKNNFCDLETASPSSDLGKLTDENESINSRNSYKDSNKKIQVSNINTLSKSKMNIELTNNKERSFNKKKVERLSSKIKSLDKNRISSL